MTTRGTFVERHPQERGAVLWCADCGERCPAARLDWSQLCPVCVRWWRDNPPPDAAGAATGQGEAAPGRALADLFGSDPDFTDGQDSATFVREGRGR